ncbi:ribonuclease H-like domain-containing protein [Tanacetum coccineum]
MVPRAVLMKSSLVSVNTVRQVNIAHLKITVNSAKPMINLSKSAHSTVKWLIHKNTSFKNNNFNQRVNTVKDKKFNTARLKEVVNAARPKAVVNDVKGNNVNVVKASACWVWKPKTKVLDHVSKHNSASITLKKFDYVDAQGNLMLLDNSSPNGVAERKNRTLIEAARTMLADSKLPTTFWAEAVNTACYVQNKASKSSPAVDSNLQEMMKRRLLKNQEKEVNAVGGKSRIELPDDPNMPALEDIVYSDEDKDVGAEADMKILDAFMPAVLFQLQEYTKIIQLNKLLETEFQAPQTRRMTKNLEEHVKRVTTRGGKMTSKATLSIEIIETGTNKIEPLRFEQDVQENSHDDGVENKSSGTDIHIRPLRNWKELSLENNYQYLMLARKDRVSSCVIRYRFLASTEWEDSTLKANPPGKKRASKPEIIASSIAESHLWKHFKVCTLKENMRLLQLGTSETEQELARTFTSWLLDIGDGNI